MMKDKEIQELLDRLSSNVKGLKITYAGTLFGKHMCHIELDIGYHNVGLYNTPMDGITKLVDKLANTPTVSE